jgi:hypothetical protein
MRKLIWIFGTILVLLWSATCFGAYALLDVAARAAQHGAEWPGGYAPEWQYWTQWAVRLAEGMGGVVVWIAWAFGTFFILAGTWAMAAIAKRFAPKPLAPTASGLPSATSTGVVAPPRDLPPH